MRVGLVGCVKSKRPTRSPAQDLYTSALFRGRRRYVEATCERWYILSAKHGLLAPTDLIDPYDESLTDASRATRQHWSESVLASLRDAVGDLRSHTFEIHAGAAYRDFGLVTGLTKSGAAVDVPAVGLRQGEQLQFYQAAREARQPS
jgi:hypothetical protein